MTIEYRYEFPYPRNLTSVPKIEQYLKSLHAGLMAFQTGWGDAIERRIIELISSEEIGWTDVGSNPQAGEYRIKDFRLSSTKEPIFTYDETPLGSPTVYANITSTPGAGEYAIRAIHYTPEKRLQVLYDETPGATAGNIKSNPVKGDYRIKYLRYDSNKDLVVVYDETPKA